MTGGDVMEKLRAIFDEYRTRIIIGGIAGIILLLLGWSWWQKNQATELTELDTKTEKNAKISQSSTAMSKSSSIANKSTFFVDIKGAIAKPGVYRVNRSQRVNDVVMAAGGLLKTADSNRINLSLQLHDQQIIFIPFQNDASAGSSQLPTTVEQTPSASNNVSNATDSTTSSASSTITANNESDETASKIDLNSATKEQLMQINGIGEKKAAMIINYRQEHGSFKKLEDLKNITGIGDKTFAVMAESLIVGNTTNTN
jgi:competence protein ComEA